MDLGPGGLSSPGPSGYGGGYDATSTGGGGDNDPYQGFVKASQPRGLNRVTRTVGDGIQTAKNFFSNPVNRRGIIGSLIGSAFLGPLGILLGGYLGKNYGGGITSAIGDKTKETLDNFKSLGNPNKYLTKRPTSGYEDPDRAKEKDKALEEFYKENPDFRPKDKQSGIINTMVANQLSLPFDFINTGDPFKDNYYDRDGTYVGPTVTG